MSTAGVINWSTTAATNATADSAANWAEGMAPSAVNDSARGEMASVAKYRDDISGSLTTGGTSTAYTLATNQDIASFSVLDGKELAFTVHTTSGATPTLNVDSLGAKNIRHATGATLPTGALVSGSVYRVKYSSSGSEFLLMNQLGVLPASLVTTAAIADAGVTYAKIQNVTASRLLGNPTGSAAAPSEISLGSDIAFSGTSINPKVGPSSVVGFLSGLELSTAGSSATFGIAAGSANDVAQADMMALASAYTKTISAWAVGTGNGALDTGTIAPNTGYHVFLIKRSDTSVVDVLVSTSASAPTMPSGYDRKRRIGSLKTNGSSQWTKFVQVGDEVLWDIPVQDYDTSTLTTTASTITLASVPTGVVTTALGNIRVAHASANAYVMVSSTDVTDSAPSDSVAPGATFMALAAQPGFWAGRFSVRADTSAQIRARSSQTNTSFRFVTLGYIDRRGK